MDSSILGVKVAPDLGAIPIEADGPALVDPGAPAAVQDLDVGMAVVVQAPPQPAGIEALIVVVNNDQGIVADAQVLAEGGELLRGQDMQPSCIRVLGVVIGDQHCPGNVAAQVASLQVTVHHHHVGVVKMGRQPFRVHQVLRVGETFSGCHIFLLAENSNMDERDKQDSMDIFFAWLSILSTWIQSVASIGASVSSRLAHSYIDSS